MKKFIGFILSLYSILLVAGCSGPTEAPTAPQTFGGNNARPLPDADQRKIIRTAHLTLSVADPEESFRTIREKVSAWGGFVQGSNFQTHTQNPSANLTIRVPSHRLDSSLQELGTLGDVLSQSEQGQDVSDQYKDLESQLRNLKVAEQRLLQLVKETGSVKDLLETEKEVTRVRGEIEKAQGQLNQLEHQVAMSTITIDLLKKNALNQGEFWRLGEAVQGAWNLFHFITRALVWVLIYSVFLLPFALPFWWVRRKKSKKSVNTFEH